MLEFEYFRRGKEIYRPRTANTALKAVEAHLVPSEACVHLGTSIKPLDEEPIDLDAVDQVLSRPQLDLDTNLLLMRVLSKLLRDPDAEVALFAAESINMIETRYTKRIESLKSALREKIDEKTLRSLAEQYYQLAQIHPGSIRNFYLREAFGYIKRLNKLKHLGKEDVVLTVRILLALDLVDQAGRIIDQLASRKDLSFRRLEMEVAFKRKDIVSVQKLCDRLEEHWVQLDEDSRSFLSYWLEGSR
jgi:hypothetical protein